MYAWIWRHLPFGLPGRIAGSLLLAAAVSALLWFVVFPAAEPLLPFNDVQVTDDGGDPGSGPGGRSSVPESTPANGVIPYSTVHNSSPSPRPSGR